MNLLFWNINEYGQVPVGEYAAAHSGMTLCVCMAVAFVLFILFREK